MDTLRERLGLSRRSILYLFRHLNEELAAKGLAGLGNLRGQGYVLPPATKVKILEQEQQDEGIALITSPGHWRLSLTKLKEEEALRLLAFILISRRTTSLRVLQDIFANAKNTLLRLLGKLPGYLSGSNLKIQVTGKGRQINGEEREQRRWVLENIAAVAAVLKRFYTILPPADMLTELRGYETVSSNRFTEDTRRLLALFLTWYIERLHRGKILSYCPSRGYVASEAISRWGKDFLSCRNLHTAIEHDYLLEVLGYFAFSRLNKQSARYDSLHDLAKQMTEQFFMISGFTPGLNHQMMLDSLTVHLVSAWHRLSAGIRYHNPLLGKIKEEYPNLFVISRAAARPMEDYMGRKLPEDEIALLATYFGSDVTTQQMGKEVRQIMVICSSGIGTSQFLLMQLREKYPQLRFAGPFRVSDVGRLSLENVGLLLTTTELTDYPELAVPIQHISPLPDKYEWEILEQRLLSLGFTVAEYGKGRIDALLDIISEYARIEDEHGLRLSLTQYFKELGKGRGTERIAQDTLLKDICWQEQELDSWQQAIWIAFGKLLHYDLVEKRYVERIIELTKSRGEYMLLGRGILLAHARPEDGVKAAAAALTVLAHPVKLDSGRKVHCIISLAPADQSSHLDFLAALLKHINRPEWCEQLCHAGSQQALEKIMVDF